MGYKVFGNEANDFMAVITYHNYTMIELYYQLLADLDEGIERREAHFASLDWLVRPEVESAAALVVEPLTRRIQLLQRVLEMVAVNFRSAWLISRACKPILLSPISPSSSLLGTRAATESITTTSNAPERIKRSAISNACSP